MKKTIIKIKVLKGAPELQDKKLSLVEIDEGLFKCIDSKIEIIDAWGNLELLEEYSKDSLDNTFYDMQIFSTSFGDEELKFIEEIKFLGTKSMLEEGLERIGIKINKIKNVEPNKNGEFPF
ncbi:MAG: hypothetical protein HQ541_13655 [Mariniphaga sp.]|nr:hypothetical protein [Mariniphaga sp.]